MWWDVMDKVLLRRRGMIPLMLLLLLIIKMLQILRKIVRGHVHVPIPFSPYIAVRFAVAVAAVASAAARRHYRVP
jgi:hypothetical protein